MDRLIEQKEQARERKVWWHWQNLNDKKDGLQGSGIRHGRAWLHFPLGKVNWGSYRTIRLEWKLLSSHCGLQMDIGDEDVTLMLAFPPCSLFFSLSTNWSWLNRILPRKTLQYYPDTIVIDDRTCGIRIHSGRLWIHPWCMRNEWRSADPWWTRGVSFNINPFEWKFMSHEVRLADGSWATVPSWKLGEDRVEPQAEEFTLPYIYVLKDGVVQHRTAVVKVERREWRPLCLRWTSLFAKVQTSIDVKFDDEVGEQTGSWKGSCIGCGYELLPGETVLECLQRMERERKF